MEEADRVYYECTKNLSAEGARGWSSNIPTKIYPYPNER
jgi:hypothetical protein